VIKTTTSILTLNALFSITLMAKPHPNTIESISKRICPADTEWRGLNPKTQDCELLDLEIPIIRTPKKIKSVHAFIRSGYLQENQSVPFKGNIIYYEGLGDSMLNHEPLFQQLTQSGFRVIAFDYMGQGGSSGTMNNTRIANIRFVGNHIWNRYARDLKHFPKHTIIGWSTGGLAAYAQSIEEQHIDNLVLIAPGIVPNLVIGEWSLKPFEIAKITVQTLTTAVYSNSIKDPHIDPIKPTSPLEVPLFATNLITSSLYYRTQNMKDDVKGFVLLSGNDDTYVDAEETKKVLDHNAPNLKYQQYSGALHEIDNETESQASPIGPKARTDILQFLLSL